MRIKCPKCGEVVRLDAELAGSIVPCPGCKGKLRVPEARSRPADGVTRDPAPVRAEALTVEGAKGNREVTRAPLVRPHLPQHVEVRPYRSDGGISLLGLPLLFGAVFFVGLVLAFAVSFVSQWLYLIVLFPIFIGAALGGSGVLAVRLGKVRSPVLAGLTGFLAGALTMLGVQFFDYLAFQSAVEEGHVAAAGVQSFLDYIDHAAQEGVTIGRVAPSTPGDKGMNLGYVGTYIYWLVEAVLASGFACVVMAHAARKPFCRSCGTWKKDHRLATLENEAENRIVKVVREGALGRLGDFEGCENEFGVRVVVAVCPRCGEDAPVDLRVERVRRNPGGPENARELAHVSCPGEALAVLQEVFGKRV